MLNQAGQLQHFIAANQAHAAQCAVLGIEVGTGIEVNPEMSATCWKTRLKADPDWAEFGWIMGAEGFNGTDAVRARWQRSAGAGTVPISVLPVGSAGDCLEVKAIRSWGLQLDIPDRISC